MKRFTLFLTLLFVTSLVFAQMPGIYDPNAKVTVTKEQITEYGQNNPDNPSEIIDLTFEGCGDVQPIGNFYNGGAGGNYGITFSNNSLSIISADGGGSGNFCNNSSPYTCLFFQTGSVILNVSGGFTTGFSFYYSSSQQITIYVWDGLDGTGNQLTTQSFPANHNTGSGCPCPPYNSTWCHWDPVGVSFLGTAHSITFSGAPNNCGFDDVTFGSPTPGPTNLSATASVLTNVSCYGGSDGSVTVSASGGTTPYTYAWSTSPVQSTQTATGLTAGTYWVTVTDVTSATATSSATITQPSALTANAGVLNNVSCYGGSDGSVNVTIGGGTTPYSYTWSTSPVQNNQSATGLTIGTYWVTVTDAHSCTATSSATVTQPASPLTANAGVLTNVLCYGASTGSVNVTVDGGTTPYSFTWSSSPVQTTQSATGLPAGTYWVTVTDANSCTATSSAAVTQPAAALTANAGVLVNVSCYGGSDGSVNVTISGGTPSYTFAWSTSPVQTTQSATGLPSGTYWVTVTDANSCTAISSAAVTQPAEALTANAGVLANVSCYGGSDGSVNVTVNGGTTPYSFAWSTSPVQTTQSATGLPAGMYWVTVTDANSCTAASSTTVTQPAALSATASVVNNVTCYQGSDGSVTVSVTGGTTAYSYTWSTSPVQTTQSATGLTAGAYSVTVTDNHGCSATSSTTVTQPAQWWPGLTGPVNVCQNSTGNIYTTESGMSNYIWVVSAGGTITAGGTTTSNSVTVTWNTSGSQSVSVKYTNLNGCTAVDPGVKNVTVYAYPTPDISGATTVTVGQTVTYTTPYVPGHSYSWAVNCGYAGICQPNQNCCTVTWINCCYEVPPFIRVTETVDAAGCSTTVTEWITLTP